MGLDVFEARLPVVPVLREDEVAAFLVKSTSWKTKAVVDRTVQLGDMSLPQIVEHGCTDVVGNLVRILESGESGFIATPVLHELPLTHRIGIPKRVVDRIGRDREPLEAESIRESIPEAMLTFARLDISIGVELRSDGGLVRGVGVVWNGLQGDHLGIRGVEELATFTLESSIRVPSGADDMAEISIDSRTVGQCLSNGGGEAGVSAQLKKFLITESR